MLRAMVLIMLAFVLLVVIITQILMPMFVEQLDFFWYFKRNARNDIITIGDDESEDPGLYKKAYEAKKNYKNVKGEIKHEKDKLDRLDKATDL